jgi:hypothetical protein
MALHQSKARCGGKQTRRIFRPRRISLWLKDLVPKLIAAANSRAGGGMADTQDLGSCAERHGGSNPPPPTLCLRAISGKTRIADIEKKFPKSNNKQFWP